MAAVFDRSFDLAESLTSEKWTPLNSEQRTLISPLSQYKLPPKTDNEDNADACRPLSLRHRCWIQRSSAIVPLLRIVLAFLVIVKQQRGPKMRSHRVQQSLITTPTGSIPNAYNRYLDINILHVMYVQISPSDY